MPEDGIKDFCTKRQGELSSPHKYIYVTYNYSIDEHLLKEKQYLLYCIAYSGCHTTLNAESIFFNQQNKKAKTLKQLIKIHTIICTALGEACMYMHISIAARLSLCQAALEIRAPLLRSGPKAVKPNRDL
jgi:hypothetical protein